MEGTDECVRAVKGGDIERYGVLIQRYQQQIYKYCFHMLGQLQEAEDVTQDVFLKGLERLEQYREGTSFSAWLYKIAYHECLNKRKRARTYRHLLHRWFGRGEPNVQEGLVVEGLTFNTQLQKALLQLSPKERHIIWLRIVEEKSFEELAQLQGMSYAAIRKCYERARKKLKREMDKKEVEGSEQSLSY